MAKYITKQRKVLLDYLQEHPYDPLTARQIADALLNENISMSAVYRNICELEKEGKLRRVSRNGSREAYYQYTDLAECKTCLHLSCKKCGKTFHMTRMSTEMILGSIAKNDKFIIDKTDTVIYGICRTCRI